MLEKKTVLSKIEFEPQTGVVFVRLDKAIFDDGKLIFKEPHRTGIEPEVAAADQMAAVNNHLSQLGYPAVTAGDLTHVSKFVTFARSQVDLAGIIAERQKAREELAAKVADALPRPTVAKTDVRPST